MCGIGGILRISPDPGMPERESIPDRWLDAIDAAVRHRGPDGAGRFRARVMARGAILDIGLVHRRLSILDHAGGAQPMAVGRASARCARCESLGFPSLVVVLNGCLYNHRELRRELALLGHEFTSAHSDTEVFLHAHAEWGSRAFDRHDGMYAVGLLDAATPRLLLARDRFGEKPLYVAADRGMVAFASVPTPALTPMTPPAIDRPALERWIMHGHDPIATPFAGVRQLAPGELVEIAGEAGGLRETRSRIRPFPWPTAAPESPLTVDEVDSLLGESVRARLDADVPLACLLSGGVDSSLVAWHARRHAPELRTICVRMPATRYDESAHAERAAAIIGSTHETIDAGERPVEDLISLVRSIGLPFADSSLLPTYWACRAASASARVLLTGDGGDELFFGYDRYFAASKAGAPGLGLAARLLGPVLPRRDPKSCSDRAARLLDAARGRGYVDLLGLFSPREFERLAPGSGDPEPHRGIASVGDARRFDVEHHLPGDMLRKVDGASMRAGVEARAPMLAGALADAAIARQDPPARRADRKRLLRELARRFFPADLVDRPKQGFAIPIGEWFRSDFGGMRALLLDRFRAAEPFGPDRLGINAVIDRGEVERLIREHDDAGRASVFPWRGRDHSGRLYGLLVLSIWAGGLASPG